MTPVRDSLLFPALEPASSSPQASRERPWPSSGSARRPSPTLLSALSHTPCAGAGSLGCFLPAPPPGTFEASHSTPFRQARSLVKVTQTNAVSQHFVFRVLRFRRRRGWRRPTVPPPQRPGHKQGRDLPHTDPNVLRHLPQPRSTNIPRAPARGTSIQECPSGGRGPLPSLNPPQLGA